MNFKKKNDREENSKTDENVWSQIQLEEENDSDQRSTSSASTNKNNNATELFYQKHLQEMEAECDHLKAAEKARLESQQTSRAALISNSIPDPNRINDWAADAESGMSDMEGPFRNQINQFKPSEPQPKQSTTAGLQSDTPIRPCP